MLRSRASFLSVPAGIFLLGAITTTLVSAGYWRLAATKDRDRFAQESLRTLQLIDDRVDTYVAMLRGAAGLFAASEDVTRDEFRRYVERLRLREKYPGVQALGFGRRVPAAGLDAALAKIREETSTTPRGEPGPARAEYVVVDFVEPLTPRNRRSLGYVADGEAVRGEALKRARDQGEPAASGRVSLIQFADEGEALGFLLFLPVYEQHEIPPTEPERREKFQGVVYCSFHAANLFNAILKDGTGTDVGFEAFDGAGGSTDGLLFRSARFVPSADLAAEHSLSVGGRTWTLRFCPTGQFHRSADPWTAAGIAVAGLLMSLAFSVMTAVLLRARELAARHAERLGHEAATLATLNRAGATLVNARDLQAVVQTVTDTAREVTGASMTAFFYSVSDHHDQHLSLFTLSGVPREAFAGFPAPRNTGVFGPSFRGEANVRSADITKDSRYGHNAPYEGMPTGHPRVRSYMSVPVKAPDGRVLGVLIFGHPEEGVFTEQHEQTAVSLASQAGVAVDNARLYQSLSTSEERYRSLVSASTSVIFTTDPEGRFAEKQPSWEGFTGVRASGEWMGEAVHPEDRARIAGAWGRALEAKCPFEAELRLLHQESGEHRRCAVRVVPMLAAGGAVREWVGTITDIHERRQLEEQLAQASTLESIGRLAGGVAHDFNNMLAVIMTATDLAEQSAAIGKPANPYLANIRDASQRAAELTGQLLAFARKKVIEPAVVNLNERVHGVSGLLRPLLGARVKLVTQLDESLGRTRIDPGQFDQVLLNLAANARDAMPEGGTLTIETRNSGMSEEYARLHPGVVPGDYVSIIMTDTGVGMEKSIQKHVFEPFFTTKARGKGTGLGLAMCYGIIRQAGGFIWLYSEPGRGTSFRIHLPRVYDQAAPRPMTVRTRAPGGTETVLVVEDERLVRSVAVTSLRRMGYQVLEASSGEEALALAGDATVRFDLLFTDVVLPRMTGKQLTAEISRLRGKVRVLYTSGYTDNVIIHQGEVDSGVHFLPKPYTPDSLATKVREVLDAERDGKAP